MNLRVQFELAAELVVAELAVAGLAVAELAVVAATEAQSAVEVYGWLVNAASGSEPTQLVGGAFA